jgi:predicted O-methyltransferase YrrM
MAFTAAALAMAALAAVGWYWLQGGARFWVLDPWIDRLLWSAVALASTAGLVHLFSKWREYPTNRKIALGALTAAVVAVSVSTLDLKSKVPAGQVYGRYRFSQDGTTKNTERWRSALSHLIGAAGVHGVEVGTYEGRSAIWFLENILTHPSSSITCIDLFDGPYDATFDHNLATFAGRVRKLRAPSQLALRSLEPWSYDFAYIDGSHTAKDVLLDAMLVWDLVKPGGIVIFDDYGWAGLNEELTGDAFTPRIAVDAFLHVLEPYIEIVHKEYQVIVRKRTEFNRQSPQAMPRKNQ